MAGRCAVMILLGLLCSGSAQPQHHERTSSALIKRDSQPLPVNLSFKEFFDPEASELKPSARLVFAARLVKYGVTAGRPNGFLAMDQFPGTGLITTHSLNSIVTDSAPGMACYTTGNHSKNGQEGVYPANMTNAFFFPRVEDLG